MSSDRHAPEPSRDAYTTAVEYLEAWVDWAQEEMRLLTNEGTQLEMTVFGLRGERDGLKAKLAEAEDQLKSYERVISAREVISAYKPGSLVFLPGAGNIQARVFSYRVSQAGVEYDLGWWGPEASWVRENIPADEVVDQLPLLPPASVFGKGLNS
jgi:hypothetical protein